MAKIVVTRDALRQANRRASRQIAALMEPSDPQSSADSDIVIGLAIHPDSYQPNARARALLRGVERSQALLEETGGAFSLEQVQAILGISRQAVDKKVKEGGLLTVPGPSNRRHYPAIQFSQAGVLLPGLKAVLARLPLSNPFAILNFLVEPLDLLDGQRPVDRLRAGDTETVARAAGLFAEQGA